MAGSIRKRTTKGGAERWQARIPTPSGTRTATFARRKDAQAWLDSQAVAIGRGEWVDPHASRVTLAWWVERWWPTLQQRASTQAVYRSHLECHVLPAFGHLPLDRLDHLTLSAWVAHLSEHLKPETVHRVFRVLRLALAAAVRAKMLPANPCDGIRLPTVERDEMRILTPGQVEELADAIDPRYSALVTVAAYSGLRIGELAALRWSRVDPMRRTLRVAEAASETAGRVDLGPPKTRAAIRTVTLPRWVAARLEAHARDHTGRSPDGFVFPAPAGGVLPRTRFRARFWLPAVEAAALDGLRVHDLRHTAVSLWIQSGADVKTVAVRAGHTSVSVVLDRYGHLYGDADAALADALEHLAPQPSAEVVRVGE